MGIVEKHSLGFLSLVLTWILLCLAVCTVANEDLKTSLDDNNIITNETASSDTITWCIARPSTDFYRLELNINECCKHPQVDCSVINPGGSCYQPENIVSQASVAMNLYYKAFGRNYWNCDFAGTGLTISQDPSVGSCCYAA